MLNFTGSWARAANPGMPAAVNPMGQPGAGDGTGGGQMIGSLRPKPNPQAGLNEAPKTSPMNGMLQSFMYQMLGIKPPKPKAKPVAPAAGLAESRTDRMDRAQRLMNIGAGLMD